MNEIEEAARGHVEVYQRADRTWAWRAVAGNGRIVATDGGQGYENRDDCEVMALAVTSGSFTKGTVPTVRDGVWTES